MSTFKPDATSCDAKKKKKKSQQNDGILDLGVRSVAEVSKMSVTSRDGINFSLDQVSRRAG